MRRGKRIKLKRSVITLIVTAVVVICLSISLLITDIFIPVKYLTAYTVRPHPNERGTMRVSYIDVGFGDSTLIELPDGKNVLIDGGNGAYSNTLHILKLLNSRGVDKIDCLICTSVKSEHCGGLAEIVKYKEVECAYIPYCRNTRITGEYHSFVKALESKKVPYAYACVGEGIEGDDYFLTFLSPTNYLSPDGEYAALNSNPIKRNIENASAVVWLEFDGVPFVFTSDVRAEGLKRIVEEYTVAKELGQPYCSYNGRSVELDSAKILTAPAHGGKDNNYAPWYELTEPEQVIISVGKNYADYPSNEALSDILIYAKPRFTMNGGTVTVTVKDGAYKIS
ncbi:MAG: MBL fold metallo-hydrolase [Clostridia bacterium]|nr:MBL fold metallo-hydrolase [Clostridia bacterium]